MVPLNDAEFYRSAREVFKGFKKFKLGSVGGNVAFVRAKRRQSKRGEKVSYQLVEAYREGGRAQHRVLLHLGEYLSLDEALNFGAANLRKQEAWLAEARVKREEAERRIRSIKWVQPWIESNGGQIPEKWDWFQGERAPSFITKYYYYRQRCRALESHLERTRVWMAKARDLKQRGIEVTVSAELIAERDRRRAARKVALAEVLKGFFRYQKPG